MNPYDIVDRLLEADHLSTSEKQALAVGLKNGPTSPAPANKRPNWWSKEGQQVRAQDLFARGANASHGSLEGAPPEDPGLMPPQDVPHTHREAQAKKLHWHVPLSGRHQGRKVSTSIARSDAVPHYPRSEKIARTRNDRRTAFGYQGRASLRDRGWPTGGQWSKRRQQPQVPVDEPPYEV